MNGTLDLDLEMNQNSDFDLDPDLRTVNSTPATRSNDFVNTRMALETLNASLTCQHCHQNSKDIYHLGCNHCFCRSCAEPKLGKVCPVCKIPAVASDTKVDLQLSNIASLCQQMIQVLDYKKDWHTVSNSAKKSKNTLPLSPRNKYDQLSSFSTLSTSSSKKAHISKFADTSELESQGDMDDDKSFSQLSQKSKEIEVKSRRRSAPDSSIKKQNQKGPDITTKSPVVKSQDSKDHHEEDPVKSITKSRSKQRKSGISPGNKGVRTKISRVAKSVARSNLCKRNTKGETPLQVATIKNEKNIVKELLEAGANPNVKDNAGWTPLHEAVNHGNIEITALLIANGASVNTPGLDNDTPLHDAVSNNHFGCIRLLLSKGASINLRNSHGQTPMEVALTDEVKQLLLSSSTDVTKALNTSSTAEDIMFEQPNKSLCLMTSLLNDQAILEKFLESFDCKMQDNFSPEVTHLVMGSQAKGAQTLKYLNSILSGKWIVSSDWLEECVKAKKILPEKAYLMPSHSNHPEALLRAVENRLKQLPPLFDGCQFYLYPKFDSSNFRREQIIELIKLGGGVILSREPRLHNLDDYPYTHPYHAQDSSSLADCTIFKIYDNSCKNPPSVKSQRMSCLPLSWLIDSISAFSLLEKTEFIVS